MLLRPAEFGDVGALTELTVELGYPSSEAEIRKRLRLVGELGELHKVFVAEKPRGRVAAWLHVFVSYRLESDPFAEIGGLVVGEGHRGAGLGEALVEQADSWARERGISRLRVRSNVIRQGAHRFYERLGFERIKDQVVLQKQLESGSRPSGS